MTRLRARAVQAIAALAMVAFSGHAAAQEKEIERTGGPYVPTPQIIVDQMLRFANVGPKDFVLDLGSGDGVIVLSAATQMKASGFGVDIDAALVQKSNAEAKRLGVAERASFAVQDIFKADVSRASVITLYLLPAMMMNLRPKILAEAKPGTRVVSHDYHFDDWYSDDQITFDVPEKEKITGVPKATIHLWVVPARVEGKWQVQMEGGEQYEISLRQKYQNVSGAEPAGRAAKLTFVSLRGEEIRFSIAQKGGRRNFSGTAQGDAMQGTVELSGGKTARWTAKRIG